MHLKNRSTSSKREKALCVEGECLEKNTQRCLDSTVDTLYVTFVCPLSTAYHPFAAPIPHVACVGVSNCLAETVRTPSDPDSWGWCFLKNVMITRGKFKDHVP